MKKLLPILLSMLASATGLAQQTPLFIKKAADISSMIKDHSFAHTAMGDKLYFCNAQQLFVTDGTAQGTQVVKEFPQNGQPVILSVLNGKLLFFVSDNTHGRELWVSDGTEAGTKILVDINAGIANGIPPVYSAHMDDILPVLNNDAYFYANNGSDGIELWKTDGTTPGTVMVANVNTTPGEGIRDSFSNKEMTVYNNKLYFHATTPADGEEIWSTDGTAAGTQRLTDIVPGNTQSSAGSFFVFNNKLLFSAVELATAPNGYVAHIYAYDGSNITPLTDSVFCRETPEYHAIGNKVFFIADYAGQNSLYVSDGTRQGTTSLLHHVNFSLHRRRGVYLSEANGLLTFITRDGTGEHTLWASDGTVNGTGKIKTFPLQAMANTTFGIKTCFRVFDTATSAIQVWTTDGTTQGTQHITYPGADYKIQSVIIRQSHLESTLMVHGTRMYYFNGYTNSDNVSLYSLDMWPASIDIVSKEKGITVYPNPATASIIVQGENIKQLKVINIAGTVLYSSEVHNNNTAGISTEQWAPGIYIVSATLNDGSTVTKRLVKK